MACKNINKRRVLKSTAIGFLLAGLFLLSYSQVVYVEEVNADLNNLGEGCKVEMLDVMTMICFLAAFLLDLVGSFAKDSSKQSFRSSVRRMISFTQRRRGGKDESLMTDDGHAGMIKRGYVDQYFPQKSKGRIWRIE